MTQLHRGRPLAEAPRGRVTISEAARRAEITYTTAYRKIVTNDEVAYAQADNGVITVRESDVEKLCSKKREPSDDPRKAVMVRPSKERYAVWAVAAGAKPVSTWLADLADRAARR